MRSHRKKMEEGCFPRNEDFERPPKSVKKIKEKPIVKKYHEIKIDPVDRTKQTQTYVHEQVSKLGLILENKYYEDQKNSMNDIFVLKQSIAEERMKRQLKIDVERIQSAVREKYEKKLIEFTKDMNEQFKKTLMFTEAEAKRKCEKTMKQHAVDVKLKTLANIDKSLTAKERDLKREFGFFREQNLEDFREYYRKLIVSNRQKFRVLLNDVTRSHRETYGNTKKLLQEEYQKAIDSFRIELENKLSSLVKSESVVESLETTVRDGDESNRNKTESLEKRLAEKVDKLNLKDRQLEFCEGKIKAVLNNYAKLATLTKQTTCSGQADYALDQEGLFQKYLGHPTAVELEQSIQDEE